MKTEQCVKYVCEYCNTAYSTEKACRWCEEVCKQKKQLLETEKPKFNIGDIVSYDGDMFGRVLSIDVSTIGTKFVYCSENIGVSDGEYLSLVFTKGNLAYEIDKMKSDIQQKLVDDYNIDVEFDFKCGKLVAKLTKQ